jgi:hypothetical protein
MLNLAESGFAEGLQLSLQGMGAMHGGEVGLPLFAVGVAGNDVIDNAFAEAFAPVFAGRRVGVADEGDGGSLAYAGVIECGEEVSADHAGEPDIEEDGTGCSQGICHGQSRLTVADQFEGESEGVESGLQGVRQQCVRGSEERGWL